MVWGFRALGVWGFRGLGLWGFRALPAAHSSSYMIGCPKYDIFVGLPLEPPAKRQNN